MLLSSNCLVPRHLCCHALHANEATSVAVHQGGRNKSKALSLFSCSGLNTRGVALPNISVSAQMKGGLACPALASSPPLLSQRHGVEGKHGPGRRNPMFPGRLGEECQEETRTFKGQATGGGFVGSCSLCQGLLSPPPPKHPEKKIRSVAASIQRLTPPPPPGEQSPLFPINNESILSACMSGQPGAARESQEVGLFSAACRLNGEEFRMWLTFGGRTIFSLLRVKKS